MRTNLFGAHSGYGAPGDRSEQASATTGRGERGRGLHEEQIERTVLANGVTVLSRYLPDPDIVAISFGARGGARNEDDRTAGVTKFLEKLYVQGTTRRPGPELVQRPLTVRGAGVSAVAGSELVVMQSQVRTADLDIMLDVLSDVVLNSTFAEERIENERRVILEELRARRSSPNAYASDLFYPAVFGSHPLARSTAGDAENTPKLNRETIVGYRDRLVVGANTVIAVAGNLPSDQAFAQVEKYFGAMPAGVPVDVRDVAPPPPNPGRIDGQAGSSQARVMMGGPLPGLRHEDRFALSVANAVLGGSGMRLFREIRDIRGLSYDPAPAVVQYPDAGLWMAAAGTDPVNIDTVIDLLGREVRRLAEEPLSEDDISNARNFLDGSLVVGLETFSAQVFQMVRDEAYGVRVLSQAHREGIMRVTQDDVMRVAQTYLRPDAATVVVVRP